MKPEEAIKILNKFPLDARESGYFEMIQAIGMATEALEKQIPKKVIIEKNGAKRCPSCGVKHFNPKWKPEVCDCTQKLDWGKE